ncbi:hypothetical protein [Thermoplasma sp.]|uniref:hypothetical protein n=1 Tax=Thermoplasma sp. TaxID=1973142 RepID=UPI002608A633|nr:hypothetical protein [Thermoplasma sp.]
MNLGFSIAIPFDKVANFSMPRSMPTEFSADNGFFYGNDGDAGTSEASARRVCQVFDAYLLSIIGWYL